MKNWSLKCLFVTLTLALMFAAPATAQEKKAESQAKEKSVFQKHDLDANGTFSLDEYLARRGAWFDEMDADGDGALTAEEYAAYHRERFKVADGDDQDGFVTMDEYLVFFAGPDYKAQAAKAATLTYPEESAKTHFFKALDGNADQLVNSTEYIAHWTEVFGLNDADKDGKVTLDEWLAYQASFHKAMDADKDGKVAKDEIKIAPATAAKK